MSTSAKRSLWFARAVLLVSSLLFARIGLGYIVNPVGEATPHGLILSSPEAITIMRVSGGVFLALAFVSWTCLAVNARLLAGLTLLSTVSCVVLAVRLMGLVLDGPAPFTLRVLKPEALLVVLSTVAAVGERRRLRAAARSEKASPVSSSAQRSSAT